jgi:hypothetical protein
MDIVMDRELTGFNDVINFVQRKSDLSNEEIKRLPVSVIGELYQYHMLTRRFEQGLDQAFEKLKNLNRTQGVNG